MSKLEIQFQERSQWKIHKGEVFAFAPKKPDVSVSGLGHSWLSGKETYLHIQSRKRRRAIIDVVCVDHDVYVDKKPQQTITQSFRSSLSAREIAALIELKRRTFSRQEIKDVAAIHRAFKGGKSSLAKVRHKKEKRPVQQLIARVRDELNAA
jgi:hypothetical protein